MQQLLWFFSLGILTLPLYLAGIGLVWWLLRRILHTIAALALAVAIIGLIAVGIPMTTNSNTERDFQAAKQADVDPAHGFHFAGDLRVEMINPLGEEPRWRARSSSAGNYAERATCGRFCQSLLAVSEVTSVTVYPPSTKPTSLPPWDAVTYRRAASGCVPIKVGQDYVNFGVLPDAKDPVGCVAGGPPLSRAGLRLVSTRVERKSFLLDRVEILDDSGRMRFRRTAAYATLLAVPLAVEFTLDEHDGPFTLHRTVKNTSPAVGSWTPGNVLLQSGAIGKVPLQTGR